MNELNSKNDEGKERILAVNKEKNPKKIHTVMSIIYVVVIVLSSPIIIWSFAYGYEAIIPVLLIIGCIIVSRILINKNKLLALADILLYTPLIIILLILNPPLTVPVVLIACIYFAITLFKKSSLNNISILQRDAQKPTNKKRLLRGVFFLPQTHPIQIS